MSTRKSAARAPAEQNAEQTEATAEPSAEATQASAEPSAEATEASAEPSAEATEAIGATVEQNAEATEAGPPTPSYERAREELARIVVELEDGGQSLEEALARWQRGEELAAICQRWLDNARERLQAAREDTEPGD